jgi:ABC-type multidrug transport system permease subunit
MSDTAQGAPTELALVEVVRPGRLATADQWLDRLSERVNPILVKETRQALKSRQFSFTFALLLLFCWAWSIFGLWVMGPEVTYGVKGPEMLLGYYVILAFPLLVIVPYGAFRSLASEQEDRTYELLWITTLRPRQIVAGKLGSAVVQMLLYLSAISPCLAFTYMLRGVSFPTILLLIAWTVLASLGLSLISLLVGTLSAERHIQVVLSVLLILGLLLAFYIGCMIAWGILEWESLSIVDAEFWQACAAILTAYGSYFALLFVAAVARITFTSDNRSTSLRVVLLAQHVLFTGWMAWVFLDVFSRGYWTEILMVFLLLVGLHWYITGALMTGESPELSLRVRRQLPMSLLGRVFLTWFNPGPATGYVFAVSGMLAALAMATVAVVISASGIAGVTSTLRPGIESVLIFGAIGTSYLTILLGLGLLLVGLLRRVSRTGMVLSVLIQILLLLLGCGVPLLIETMSPNRGAVGYSLLQMSNPFWTLTQIIDKSSLPVEAPVLVTVLPIVAAIVFALNLPAVFRELRNVRIAKPARVAEEDAALAARFAPAQPTRLSPWDD